MGCLAAFTSTRTERDYERLADFIRKRDEVTDVAFEFKTGGAWRKRREYHNRHLAQLANEVARPLHLIMIGGFRALPIMARAFKRVTFVDTSAFMNALHRQRLVESADANLIKRTELTELGKPLDALLAWNIEIMRRRVENMINALSPKAA